MYRGGARTERVHFTAAVVGLRVGHEYIYMYGGGLRSGVMHLISAMFRWDCLLYIYRGCVGLYRMCMLEGIL